MCDLTSRRGLLRALDRLVAFRTVSADPRASAEFERAARWLVRLARANGINAQVVSTNGRPVVVAWQRGTPGRPTLLVYGHYDVQPAGRVGSWATPPFRAIVRGAHVRGRGVSDNKGFVLAHLGAAARALRQRGDLPLNVVWLFDGEEEVGSPSLMQALRGELEWLQPDAIVVSDTQMASQDQPAIVTSLRGTLSLELRAVARRSAVHSGTYGGAVRDPAMALSQVLASLVDRDQRPVLRPLVGPARCDAANPTSDPRSHAARVPAVVITRLQAGSRGSTAASTIPAQATATVNVRLLHGQAPRAVKAAIDEVLSRSSDGELRVTATLGRASPAVRVSPRSWVSVAASRAYARAFGCPPLLRASGGSIPAAGILQERFHAPMVLMGFALPSDRWHAPNEQLDLETWRRAIAAVEALYLEAAGAWRVSAGPLLP